VHLNQEFVLLVNGLDNLNLKRTHLCGLLILEYVNLINEMIYLPGYLLGFSIKVTWYGMYLSVIGFRITSL
jgi:hypothetical protein